MVGFLPPLPDLPQVRHLPHAAAKGYLYKGSKRIGELVALVLRNAASILPSYSLHALTEGCPLLIKPVRMAGGLAIIAARSRVPAKGTIV